MVLELAVSCVVVELDGVVLGVVVVVVVVCCVWSPVVVVWLPVVDVPVVDVPVVDVWPEGAVVVVVLWLVSCANKATEQPSVRTSKNASFFILLSLPCSKPRHLRAGSALPGGNSLRLVTSM